MIIPKLHYPFSGSFPVTFAFGAKSSDEKIKNKFLEWGWVGHIGIDFACPIGTNIIAVSSGSVVQSGINGDYGNSITIKHSWGTSLYAHLSECLCKVGDKIKVGKLIGKSGSSGAAFGSHLHFAIKPLKPDINNGYQGYVNPFP
jgi:murein DD-endopeptidase MepM/ murein hydrolase activator NlpD